MSDRTDGENLDISDISNDDTPKLIERLSAEKLSVDFGDEFGVVKFADEDDAIPTISLGGTQTEQLPHGQDMPTGQSPKFVKISEDTNSPTPAAGVRRKTVNLTGTTRRIEPNNAPSPVSRPSPAGRISIGSDPTGEQNRPISKTNTPLKDSTTGSVRRDQDRTGSGMRPPQVRRTRASKRSDSGTGPRPRTRQGHATEPQTSNKRDIPTATAVGALLGALYIGATLVGPVAVISLLTVFLGLAAVEFFSQTSSTGFQPAMVVGVIACICAPLTAYWVGDSGLPIVFAFALLAASVSFIGTSSVESDPATNMGLTMLGIIWIGLFGSYGALILRLSNAGAGFENVGTDTLLLVVVGVIANDVFAYFIGSAAGRSALRAWISPGKTKEGFVGGAIGTFAVVIGAGMQSGTWTKLSQWLIIATVISIAAPIGDLTESMIKRSLDIKDFGTLLRGHGGALDRFDSMLFTLPVIYYLTLVLAPWAS